MKKYRSKISIALIVFTYVIVGVNTAIMVHQKIWAGLVINLLLLAFITFVFLNTYYLIKGRMLIIRCSFFYNKAIDIDGIRKISEINNALKIPVILGDRLKILYNGFDSVIISPNNKLDFIDQIIDLNPDIRYKLRVKRRYWSY
jgi:hypothetical protein